MRNSVQRSGATSPHASGLLLKWLTFRNMMAEADKLSAIPVDHDDVDKLVALCEIFGVDADRQVIEAALSKDQTSRGVALHEDPEEMKFKEKYEKLSELLDRLKNKKLYLSQHDYNLFVKDKIQIEREGEVECVVCSKEICESDRSDFLFFISLDDNDPRITATQLKQVGDVVEIGDSIISIIFTSNTGKKMHGAFKTPLRGVLVEMGDFPSNTKSCREGDPIFYIRTDHDTAPAIKVISN